MSVRPSGQHGSEGVELFVCLLSKVFEMILPTSVEISRVCKCWVGPEWVLEGIRPGKAANTAILGWFRWFLPERICGVQIIPDGSGGESVSTGPRFHQCLMPISSLALSPMNFHVIQ